VKRLLGQDYFRALLDEIGHLHEIVYDDKIRQEPRTSAKRYDDAVMDKHGRVLVVSPDIGGSRHIALFQSIEDLLSDEKTQDKRGAIAETNVQSSLGPVALHAGASHFFTQPSSSRSQGHQHLSSALLALGDNRYFQLGHSAPQPFIELQEMPSIIDALESSIKSISLGDLHSCIVSEAGGLFVAGSDSKGQCSGSDASAGFEMVEFDDEDLDVVDVACGTYHTVILTNKGVYATGSSESNSHALQLSALTTLICLSDTPHR